MLLAAVAVFPRRCSCSIDAGIAFAGGGRASCTPARDVCAPFTFVVLLFRQTVSGRGPRLGTGSRDRSAPAYPKAVKREASGDGSMASEAMAGQDLDPRDAIIAELQQKVADLQDQLKAKGTGEDAEDAEKDGLDSEADDGGNDDGDAPPEEAVDPASSETQPQDADSEYTQKVAAMGLEELMAHLEARGEDLSACMALSEEEAADQCAKLLDELTVKELCNLASKRNVAMASCLSVDRGQLMKFLAEELKQDPDSLEHMSDQEMCDMLLDSFPDVDPAEFCDKAALITNLTQGIGMKALRELLVGDLGVELSDLMDQQKMIELAKERGPPGEGEEGDHEEGVDEATKPRPKPGDPDWKPSQKPAPPVGDAVKALRMLRKRTRPDWAPGRIVGGSWSPPEGTEYWKWRQSTNGKRWTLRSRQEHFEMYASAQLRPKTDAVKAVSTMTRSQMNARLTLATKLEVTERFRRNPLIKPKKTPKAGWLYKWRDDAQTWRKRWCQVEKVKSTDPGTVDSEYVLTYRAGKSKRELGSLRLLNGQLYHYGVIAQKKEEPEADYEEEPDPEPEQEPLGDSTIETGSETGDSTMDIEIDADIDIDSTVETGSEKTVSEDIGTASAESLRSRMRRNCGTKEQSTRQEMLLLETLLRSLNLESELLHKFNMFVDSNFSGGIVQLIERLVSWHSEYCAKSDISMSELSRAFLAAGLKDFETGTAVIMQADLDRIFLALEAAGRGRADMKDVRSFLLGEHHSLHANSIKNVAGPSIAQADLDPGKRLKRAARVRRLVEKYHKELLRLEMQLNTIVAAREGASVCIVVVEESGKSGLFRTDLPGTRGRVDTHSWYLALKLLLAPQGTEVQESSAESLSMGSYKYMLPDPTKVGRSSRGSFGFEPGGQQEEGQKPLPAELAAEQSEGNAVVLSGHPNAICNGEYRPATELHEGWPRYESLAGTSAGASMHLFRSIGLKKWVLSRRFVPDSDVNNSNILAEEGPLPVGTQTWNCFVKGQWVQQKLTVQLENRAVLQARVALKTVEDGDDADAIEAATTELERLLAEDEVDSDDEGSVATTGLITSTNTPGIKTPQSVFAVRARTRSLVLPDQSKFEPWRNGMRRKRVDMRKELLISSTAKEWIPNGFKRATRCSQELKIESITSGFLYPAENEKPDMP